MRRFYIDPSALKGAHAVIGGTDAKHIRNVLRLKPGDRILLFDGSGLEHKARISGLSPGQVEVDIQESGPAMAEPPVHITVAQALLKERKMDQLVRHVTELGISRWVPFRTRRSIPRPESGRMTARLQRWEKISREALKQCRRGRAPEIAAPVGFESVLEMGAAADLKIVFYEGAASEGPWAMTPGGAVKRILALLGPEGGFSPSEIEQARAAGFHIVGLGPRILRAETATLAACSLLQYLFGDMGPIA